MEEKANDNKADEVAASIAVDTSSSDEVRPVAQPESTKPALTKPAERPAYPRPDDAGAVDPVIPLVHAPDDPGIDSVEENDPVPGAPPQTSGGAWQRFKQLFR